MPSAERTRALAARRAQRAHDGRSSRSRRSSRCPSPISLPRAADASRAPSRRTPFSSRRCFRSRPAAVRKIAATARRPSATAPASTTRAARSRHGGRGGAHREGAGCDALLHGRGMARPEGSRSRARARDDPRGQGVRARDLLHAGHAERRPGREAEAGRPRLLQPQPRQLARLLRRSHHDSRLP